jgi:hypothetical protein
LRDSDSLRANKAVDNVLKSLLLYQRVLANDVRTLPMPRCVDGAVHKHFSLHHLRQACPVHWRVNWRFKVLHDGALHLPRNSVIKNELA